MKRQSKAAKRDSLHEIVLAAYAEALRLAISVRGSDAEPRPYDIAAFASRRIMEAYDVTKRKG